MRLKKYADEPAGIHQTCCGNPGTDLGLLREGSRIRFCTTSLAQKWNQESAYYVPLDFRMPIEGFDDTSYMPALASSRWHQCCAPDCLPKRIPSTSVTTGTLSG